MNINILTALPEDAIFIQEINSKTWLDTYKNKELWINKKLLEKNPTNEDSRKDFLKRKWEEIKKVPWSYFLAKDWEKVIWYAAWKKHQNKSNNELFAIYIVPEYQKKWIWKLLSHKVFDYLWNDKDILVDIIWYNKNAISFYENMWFIFNKNLDDFEIIDWIWVPEIQMIRKKNFQRELN